MPKQSTAANAASLCNSVPFSLSDRLDAIGRYIRLRDWSFAVIDLMEVAGKSMNGGDRIEIGDHTLMEASALLRDLLQQIDEQVDAATRASTPKLSP